MIMEKFLASSLLFWGIANMIKSRGEEGLFRSSTGLAWLIGILKEKE